MATGLDPTRYNVDEWTAAVNKYNATGDSSSPNRVMPRKEDFLNPGQIAESLTGDYSGNLYSPEFGGTPRVPNPFDSQAKSISGNLANFSDLSALSGKTNDLLASEYTSRLPGYGDLSQTASSNTLSQLRGELPQDVINLIGQQSAERGIGGGVSGSQFSNSDYLRSLGLTSLSQKEKGLDSYGKLLGGIKDIPMFDPSSMFISPTDVQNAQQTSNIFSAAPNPTASGMAADYKAMLPGLIQQQQDRSSLYQQESDQNRNAWMYRPGSMVGA